MRKLLVPSLLLSTVLAGAATRIVQDQCGPFTDVSPAICPYVLEMYYLGITAGTSPTTYSPDATVTRGQAAVFVSKGVNQAITRSSRRAALGQWWTTRTEQALGLTTVGTYPSLAACDGTDVWVRVGEGVARVRGSDGRLLEVWNTPSGGAGVLAAMGRIFVVGYPSNSGRLYMIDPAQPPGSQTDVAQTDAGFLAFDGARIWATNGPEFSVDIITPGPTLPWTTTPVQIPSQGQIEPKGILFDGSNIWITGSGLLMKLDENGAVLQSIDVGTPGLPVFDGANIWVPDVVQPQIHVVRPYDGAVVATLNGNGLSTTIGTAFDGRRVLVTTPDGVSVWDAESLSPIGFTNIAGGPWVPCSDGINFWVPLSSTGVLARF